MYEIVVRPLAEADLDDIAIYTKERWGRRQARQYLAALRLDIDSLAQFPASNPKQASQHGEFRKLASGHHMIFYLTVPRQIVVVRVLHERMNFEARLTLA